jgi:hypothetical protein
MWTVYDHPADFPNAYVARKFMVGHKSEGATNEVIMSDSLNELRAVFEAQGLVCLMRDPRDDPVIIETWL